MAKERAKRRAEREAAAEKARAAAQARQSRQATRRARRERLQGLIPKPIRYRRQGGLLARRRRMQNRVVLAVFLIVQVLGWLLLDTWGARLALLALSVFLVPVAVTLLFDRR